MRWRTGFLLAAVASASAACLISLQNARTIPRLRLDESDAELPTISVLVPARNESANLRRNLESVASQHGVTELLVLDDDSSDGTGETGRRILSTHMNAAVLDSDPLPAGWLGKAWACQQLCAASSGEVLVFLDADVKLEPGAIAAGVRELRRLRVDALSPYPRQECPTISARLVQPLLQWSWFSTIPWRYSLRRQPVSMAVANGQFLVAEAATYRRLGGHQAVADQVVDDVALARLFRHEGASTAVVDGSRIAACRMYETNRELMDGYAKSLWCAFGRPPGSWIVVGGLLGTYLGPPIALIFGHGVTRALGAAGTAAAVTNRVVVARATGQRVWPDALLMPVSIAALAKLFAWSNFARRRDALLWKGRPLAS